MRYVLLSILIISAAQASMADPVYPAQQPVQYSDNNVAPVYMPQASYPPTYYAQPQAAPAQPQASGDYGSSVMTDLRQLNF